MIVAGISSVEKRRASLPITLKSLVRQVDRFFVHLNGYDFVPPILGDLVRSDRAMVTTSESEGWQGDQRKFWGMSQTYWDYFITCDDDLEYPSDYVQELRKWSDKFPRYIWGVDGLCFREGIGRQTVSRDLMASYPFANGLEVSSPVHVIGTGTTIFRPCQAPPYGIFKADNMADIWLAKWAAEKAIPMAVVQRQPRWLHKTAHAGFSTIPHCAQGGKQDLAVQGFWWPPLGNVI